MNYTEIAGYALAAYETIVRAYPTNKNVSIIHGILKALTFLSSFLNVKKKGTGPNPLIPVLFCFVLFSCKTVESVTCKSTKYVEITVLRSGSYYSAVVPVCDTIIINEKPKTANK